MPPDTVRIAVDSNVSSSLGSLSRRVLFYAAWVIGCCLLLLRPVLAFVSYSLSNDNASHLVLIPAISAWILLLERSRIFKHCGSDVKAGLAFLISGAAAALIAFSFGLPACVPSLNHPDTRFFAGQGNLPSAKGLSGNRGCSIRFEWCSRAERWICFPSRPRQY